MIKVEVLHSWPYGEFHLWRRQVVFVTVHDRPEGLAVPRPAAREDAPAFHRRKRLPVFTHQQWSHRSFYCCNPARGLRVARRDSVPDTPNILPTLPADSVEKGKLEIVRFVPLPAIGNVHHVTRLKPFVAVHHWRKWISILAPGHDVVSHTLVVRSSFRFKRQRMPQFLRAERKCQRHTILRISIEAISSNSRHQRSDRSGPRL